MPVQLIAFSSDSNLYLSYTLLAAGLIGTSSQHYCIPAGTKPDYPDNV